MQDVTIVGTFVVWFLFSGRLGFLKVMPKDKNTTHARGEAIVVAVITLVCLAPFVNKAFHIDDPLFIWTAKHIQTNPSDFYGFSVNWYGVAGSMAETAQNPPLACYYIALVASLFGFSEVALHIAFIVPAVAAALGTYYLARRFCSRPVLAAMAAVLTPAFLVSSTNIMCDTMMLAFWVWAVFLWVRGIEENNRLSLFWAAVLAAICALTKYFGMALLPLLLVYSLMQKRKVGTWIAFLLIPVAILAGYQRLTYNLYGRGLLLDAAAYAIKHGELLNFKLFSKGLAGLFFTGGCIITAIFYCPLLWKRRTLISGAAVIIMFTFILSFVKQIGGTPIKNDDGIRWSFLLQIGLMAAAGVNVFGLAVADFWKNRNAESLLLLLWIFGIFLFAGFINWTINARSILPMTPAVGILLMRRIDQYNNKGAKRTKTARQAWPLVFAAVAALLVCRADYLWANTARSSAAEINKKFKNTNRTVWFQGHWGFQYYMEAIGVKPFDFNHPEKIVSKDIVVIPSNNTNINLLPKDAAYLSEFLQFDSGRNLATMDLQLGAGFYTGMWGPLPFVVGKVTPEKYYIFVIK
ncbi:MAG: glycosyltransferase family 39 protein [Sedimentisphaerales bacterium]